MMKYFLILLLLITSATKSAQDQSLDLPLSIDQRVIIIKNITNRAQNLTLKSEDNSTIECTCNEQDTMTVELSNLAICLLHKTKSSIMFTFPKKCSDHDHIFGIRTQFFYRQPPATFLHIINEKTHEACSSITALSIKNDE